MSNDRIEKEVVLRAPLERVWRAISDADEFGRWFGVRFDGPFVAGTSVTGVITPTTVDDEVAAAQEQYAGKADTWQIVAVEPGTDYSAEPTTLVEFTLTEADDGVLLRIVESGFDRIPADRRATAFEHNSEGWTKQTELVRKYLAFSEKV